jgi:hypothetical protein
MVFRNSWDGERQTTGPAATDFQQESATGAVTGNGTNASRLTSSDAAARARVTCHVHHLRATLTDHQEAPMAQPDNVQIVLSESNFDCIDKATAKGSPVRGAMDKASKHGRHSGNPDMRNKVAITCSEAQAEELLRLAQVSCRTAIQDIKTALVEARGGKA